MERKWVGVVAKAGKGRGGGKGLAPHFELLRADLSVDLLCLEALAAFRSALQLA